MQCDICGRPASSRLFFNCTLCARNALYQSRVQSAQILVQKEALKKEVEQIIDCSSNIVNTSKGLDSAKTNANVAWTAHNAAFEQALFKDRTQCTLNHVHSLREEMKVIKLEIQERKKKLERRRSEFASAKEELLTSQDNAKMPIEKGIRRTEHRWHTLHNKTAESRSFLCKEAAILHGLQQRKRKKGGPGRDTYLIGGWPIVDLWDLNNTSAAQITTLTTNLAQLVHLVSHYLSLRLPAEITLPHRDYPLPTIFSPNSSYTGRAIPFPGSTPSHSSNNSPSASRHADQRPLPKPRPLYLDKDLPVLAKDDQVAYASFVEGITFLAWDIAWLCRTQGVGVGDRSWEDVCAMGFNLWQLLLAPVSRLSVPRGLPTKNPAARPTILRAPSAMAGDRTTDALADEPRLGHFSHGTAYGFLATGVGAEHMRSWELQSPIKVVDKVKAMLLAERTGAEWEILEGDEWEEEEAEMDATQHTNLVKRPAIEETGILVKPEVRVDPVEPRDGDKEGDEGKEKGKSGWMKLKNRST